MSLRDSFAPQQPPEGSSAPARRKKRHQTLRACDLCRRKKIRCDGLDGKKIPCTNCADYDLNCTYGTHQYKQPARRVIIADGPPKRYTDALERRLRQVETLLKERCPDVDVVAEFGPPPADPSRSSASDPPSPEPSSSDDRQGVSYVDSISLVIRSILDDDDDTTADVDTEDDGPEPALRQSTSRLSLDPFESRYQNKAHETRLFHIIKDIKADYNGEPPRGPEAEVMRPHFPVIQPWESVTPAVYHSQYYFPDPELLARLVDAYFDNMNLYFPAFHRPSFIKAVLQDRLHLSNQAFGATLLAMCAVGSRFMADEPGVLTDGNSPASAGWGFFRQVADGRKITLARPTLYDVQFQLVAGQFLAWSTAPQAGWIEAGRGLRYAEDVGAHRRAFYEGEHTPTLETWKRTVWSLIVLEVLLGGCLGRQTALASNQYDLPMPTPVDDDYWGSELDGYAWRQPEKVKPLIAGFLVYVKVIRIQDVMLRTIYALKPTRKSAGLPKNYDPKIMAILDAALDECLSQAPQHIQWNPSQADPVLFKYTAALHAYVSYVRIVLHRPFIPSRVEVSHTSLTICTNAARTIARLVEVHRNRNAGHAPLLILMTFAAGIISTLNLWQCRRSGASDEKHDRFYEEALLCMNFFERHESIWPLASRFKDALTELVSTDQGPWTQDWRDPRLPVPPESTFNAHHDPLRRSFDHASVSSSASSSSPPADNYSFNGAASFGGWPLIPPHPNVEMSPTHIPHRLLPRYGAGWEAPQMDWAQPQAPGQRSEQWPNAPAFQVDDWSSYIHTFRQSGGPLMQHPDGGADAYMNIM